MIVGAFLFCFVLISFNVKCLPVKSSDFLNLVFYNQHLKYLKARN